MLANRLVGHFVNFGVGALFGFSSNSKCLLSSPLFGALPDESSAHASQEPLFLNHWERMDVDANEVPEALPNGLNNPKKRPREEEVLPPNESPKRVRHYISYEITTDCNDFLSLEAYNELDSLEPN